MAPSEYLCLKRGLRPKQPGEHPPDQVEQILHRAFIARFGASRQADGIYDSDTHLSTVWLNEEGSRILQALAETKNDRRLVRTMIQTADLSGVSAAFGGLCRIR